MEIKYVDELFELCDYFIEDNIAQNFETVSLDTDFYCYPNTKEIYVSIIALKSALDGFMVNLNSRTDINDISNFTWSFLHEVGHCMTEKYLNERTTHHCNYIKRKINRGSLDSSIYYSLSDEKHATDWAINYVANNYKIVKAFDKNILSTLTKIYYENDINLDD